MSLVVANAYRYPLREQAVVHRRIMENIVAVTKETVNNAVTEFTNHLRDKGMSDGTLDQWIDAMNHWNRVTLPEPYAGRVTRIAGVRKDDASWFARVYLFHLHKSGLP